MKKEKKPMPQQPSSIVVNQSDPALGSVVTFTTDYPPNVENASIQITAFQNGAIVFVTAGLAGSEFLLGGTDSPWLTTGGPAHCVALLYYWKHTKQEIIASCEFDAAG